MFKPEVIAFDVETTGLDFWSPSFRVISAAFSWRNSKGELRNEYLEGEEDVLAQLEVVRRLNIPLVCHNASFELGVVSSRFPTIPTSLIKYDTMRLVQVYDNGGRDATPAAMSIVDELAMLEGELVVKSGLGLEVAVNRLLAGPLRNYKQPYYKWLRDHLGVKAGTEGAHLSKLPPDLLASYNTADTDATLLLFEKCTQHFQEIGYDWALDHHLHLTASLRIAEAKARGIRVDTAKLEGSIEELKTNTHAIKHSFTRKYAQEITAIETKRFEVWANALKTEAGRARRLGQGLPGDLRFNPQSTKQLAELFIGELGQQPTFWTKENKKSAKARKLNPDAPEFIPSPSFRAAHLHSYGEGGEMLVNLKKRNLVLTQCNTLLDKASVDGKFHVDLKACGTKTGRYAGGGGLNVQGLARKEPLLMSCLVPEPGHVFVSVDLSAGEPTVTSHFSKDHYYFQACFGMVGKAPYYDESGVLLIDDLYLMLASVSPVGRETMRRAFDADWGGKTFSQQWLDDAEVIKAKLKKTRAFHKVLCLAMAYGQGPRGMVNFAYDQGHSLKLNDAKALYAAYWETLFPGVKRLGDALKNQFKTRGYLLNPFGYRLVPESDYLALNYFIQSSVSGVMKVLEEKFYAITPEAKFVTCIHDEAVFSIPEGLVDVAKDNMSKAVESLNTDLGWSVKIRTGWAVGHNLYEAK